MQKLRISFRRGAELKYISHLDMMRLWVRALRRARIPLSYSEGFSPHPKIALAAPLSVGVTGEAELMDITVEKIISPYWFKNVVNQQLPQGIEVLDVFAVAPATPSLQSQVKFAIYRVELATEKTSEDIKHEIRRLLVQENIPWHHERDTGRREYNLRSLIDSIEIIETSPGKCVLEMKLRCDENGSGRPEQVVYALGFNVYPTMIERSRLVLSGAR